MPSENLPILADEVRYGPAMSALRPQWQNFVVALVSMGCSVADAARAAGYAESGASAVGNRLAHDPRVQAALHEESIRRCHSAVPMALNVLVGIASNQHAKASDRIKAAVEILNRGGLHPVSEHHLSVTHQTEADKDREILALARELGLDDTATARLLGHKPIIEAEFTEIHYDRPGRPVTNPDRTPEERAADLAAKYRSPEEREAHRIAYRAERTAQAKARYEAAQDEQRAQKLGFNSAVEMNVAFNSDGLTDVLGLDDEIFATLTAPQPRKELPHEHSRQ